MKKDYFFTIEMWPAIIMKVFVKLHNVKWMDKIYECITHITFILNLVFKF